VNFTDLFGPIARKLLKWNYSSSDDGFCEKDWHLV